QFPGIDSGLAPGHGPCSMTKSPRILLARRQAEERHMALATQDTGRSRARLAALPGPGHLSTRIEIVENPITGHDARLGAEVEEAVERALHDENLGLVQVRFRVCQDESDGLRFICKVENPPRVE